MNSKIRLNHNYLLALFDSHIINYPTPNTLNFFWSFGSGAGICFVIQILTGVFLAMHYTPEIFLAFASIEHIMRDVTFGWFIRYLHANGASFFFIVVYLHIFRGIYYGSYLFPRELLWISGVVIFFLMIVTAFMGYVLPWGQMSFWGATVITNLFSAIPVIGGSIVEWLWGGFSVDNATLNRFFSLHYLFPFLIAGVTLIHLSLLHNVGSNNPLGIYKRQNIIPFYIFFYVKDLLALLYLLFILFIFIFFYSNTLGHSDNYIPANPLVTPPHIVPEWYFLPFYAILRSIPNKLGGVVAMVGAIILLGLLPFLMQASYRSAFYRYLYNYCFWFLFADFIILGWLGQKPVETPFIGLGLFSTILFFFIIIIALPSCDFIMFKYKGKRYDQFIMDLPEGTFYRNILLTKFLFWIFVISTYIYNLKNRFTVYWLFKFYSFKVIEILILTSNHRNFANLLQESYTFNKILTNVIQSRPLKHVNVESKTRKDSIDTFLEIISLPNIITILKVINTQASLLAASKTISKK